MPGTRGKTVCWVLLRQSEHEAYGAGGTLEGPGDPPLEAVYGLTLAAFQQFSSSLETAPPRPAALGAASGLAVGWVQEVQRPLPCSLAGSWVSNQSQV